MSVVNFDYDKPAKIDWHPIMTETKLVECKLFDQSYFATLDWYHVTRPELAYDQLRQEPSYLNTLIQWCFDSVPGNYGVNWRYHHYCRDRETVLYGSYGITDKHNCTTFFAFNDFADFAHFKLRWA